MNKLIYTFFLGGLSLIGPVSHAQSPQAKRILIVYLSRTQNTKVVATMIQQLVGGRLVELQLVNPYPKDYHQQVDQVVRENASGFLPALKTQVDSISTYDLIFIGFPTWDMQMPPPMKSFLHQYHLEGKTIVTFNTNAGYGMGSGFDKVKQLCPNSYIFPGFSTKGGIERDGILLAIQGERQKQVQKEVEKWLREIKILK